MLGGAETMIGRGLRPGSDAPETKPEATRNQTRAPGDHSRAPETKLGGP